MLKVTYKYSYPISFVIIQTDLLRFSLSLRFVLLLGSVLEDSCKLYIVKHPVLDRSLPEHFIKIIIGEPVSNSGQKLPQPVLMNQANIILVKTSKGILDNLFWVSPLQPLPKHSEEHGEVDGSRGLIHHGLQVLFSRILQNQYFTFSPIKTDS